MVRYIYQYNLKDGTTIAEYKDVIKYITSFGGEVIPEEYDLDDEPDEEAPPEINFYWDEEENEDPNWKLEKHKNCRSIGSKQKDAMQEEESRERAREVRDSC